MSRGVFLAALLAALAGCASTIPPEDVGPYAKAAALKRARADMACDAATANIIESQGPGVRAYDIDRREYRVEVRGCGKRTEYTVACTKFGGCSALAEGAIIERTQ
jgi:hypothetical protein